MTSMMVLVLPFFILVVIALTYDKTVTPIVNYFTKKSQDVDLLRTDIRDENAQIKSEYRLYDHAIIILPFVLGYVTYELFTSEVPIYYPGSSFLATLWIWIVVLFKIHRIKVYDDNALRFQGIIRNIDIDASDIIEIQDWLRFVRVKLNKGSLILFPFVDKLGEFKAEIRSLNPETKIKDMSNNYFDSKYSLGLTLLGMLIFFGCMIAFLFYRFTHLQ
jgi:hypothetical protein